MKTRGVLTFTVGGIGFGARIEEVAGLIEAERLAPIPGHRDRFAGVVAFRGAMIPAIDLSAYLGLGALPPASPRYALVLARGGDRFGLVIPEIPTLIEAAKLREAGVPPADPELASVIDVVLEAGDARIHCLNYWSLVEFGAGTNGREPSHAGREASTRANE